MPMGQAGRLATAAVAACGSALVMAQDVALGTWATAIAGGLLILVGAALGAREKIINARIATRKRESDARIELERQEQEARLAREARETEARLAIEARTKDSLGKRLEVMQEELRKLNEKGHEARNRENLVLLRHQEEMEQGKEHVRQLMEIIDGLREDIHRLKADSAAGTNRLAAGQESVKADVREALKAEVGQAKAAIEGAVAATTGVIAEGLDKIAHAKPAAPPANPGDDTGPPPPHVVP